MYGYARKNAVVTAKELASNADIRNTLTDSTPRVGAPTRSHTQREVAMTMFAQHRAAFESFIDCMHGGADKDTIARYLAEKRGAEQPAQR